MTNREMQELLYVKLKKRAEDVASVLRESEQAACRFGYKVAVSDLFDALSALNAAQRHGSSCAKEDATRAFNNIEKKIVQSIGPDLNSHPESTEESW